MDNSYEKGMDSENEFFEYFKKIDSSIKRASEKEQFMHIDFTTDSHGAIDFKMRKKISRHDNELQDEWIWVEYLNVIGKLGWLLGMADYIVFERESDYVFVKRKDLVSYCKEKVSDEYVPSPKHAHYKLYRRNGRKDKISLVSLTDIIETLPVEIKSKW